jgi:hypothetical protein
MKFSLEIKENNQTIGEKISGEKSHDKYYWKLLNIDHIVENLEYLNDCKDLAKNSINKQKLLADHIKLLIKTTQEATNEIFNEINKDTKLDQDELNKIFGQIEKKINRLAKKTLKMLSDTDQFIEDDILETINTLKTSDKNLELKDLINENIILIISKNNHNPIERFGLFTEYLTKICIALDDHKKNESKKRKRDDAPDENNFEINGFSKNKKIDSKHNF